MVEKKSRRQFEHGWTPPKCDERAGRPLINGNMKMAVNVLDMVKDDLDKKLWSPYISCGWYSEFMHLNSCESS